jgi:hypothetical protein
MHKHSTVHQLIEIYHNICLPLENHEIICSVFCDISKAFDVSGIKALLKKSKVTELLETFYVGSRTI